MEDIMLLLLDNYLLHPQKAQKSFINTLVAEISREGSGVSEVLQW